MRKGRRPSGSGSIYRCKDGRWCAQVERGHYPNGNRKYARSMRRTRAEAEASLVLLLDGHTNPLRLAAAMVEELARRSGRL